MIRKSRLKDKKLKALKPKNHEYIVSENKSDNRIKIITVKDKRTFHLISNCYINEEEINGLPSIVNLYNQHAKGVDRTNKYCQVYRYIHRIRKWWKKFFLLFLELVISNSYIIYSRLGKDITHKDFSLAIANSLILNSNK